MRWQALTYSMLPILYRSQAEGREDSEGLLLVNLIRQTTLCVEVTLTERARYMVESKVTPKEESLPGGEAVGWPLER